MATTPGMLESTPPRLSPISADCPSTRALSVSRGASDAPRVTASPRSATTTCSVTPSIVRSAANSEAVPAVRVSVRCSGAEAGQADRDFVAAGRKRLDPELPVTRSEGRGTRRSVSGRQGHQGAGEPDAPVQRGDDTRERGGPRRSRGLRRGRIDANRPEQEPAETDSPPRAADFSPEHPAGRQALGMRPSLRRVHVHPPAAADVARQQPAARASTFTPPVSDSSPALDARLHRVEHRRTEQEHPGVHRVVVRQLLPESLDVPGACTFVASSMSNILSGFVSMASIPPSRGNRLSGRGCQRSRFEQVVRHQQHERRSTCPAAARSDKPFGADTGGCRSS